MANELYITHDLGQMEHLPYGEVNLGVPLYDDRIQIGGERNDSDARVLVVTDTELITTISRLDDRPLQADILALNGERLPIFTQPVDKLVLTPDMGSAGETVWYARAAETTIGVTDLDRFAHFAQTVAYYAYCKAHGIPPIRQLTQYQKSA